MQPLIIIGIILLILGYLVSVKKQTWLLSGFNEKRVPDKRKLSLLVGRYNGLVGTLFVIAGFLGFPSVETFLIPLFIAGYVILIVYVNVRMVE